VAAQYLVLPQLFLVFLISNIRFKYKKLSFFMENHGILSNKNRKFSLAIPGSMPYTILEVVESGAK